ncbi:MAG: hypothetical protein V4572_10075 [Bacteroidota bacterium]
MSRINPENKRYRVYKISMHFFIFSYVNNSKIYTIEKGKSSIIPGIKYSLLTFFFGWWNFSYFYWHKAIKTSMTALHVNFSGGEDCTKDFNRLNYNPKTKWIYDNLPRQIADKLTIDDVDIIIEIHESNNYNTVEENVAWLNNDLKKINLNQLRNDDLINIIQTYYHYEKRLLE